jgi:hypothetical protein
MATNAKSRKRKTAVTKRGPKNATENGKTNKKAKNNGADNTVEFNSLGTALPMGDAILVADSAKTPSTNNNCNDSNNNSDNQLENTVNNAAMESDDDDDASTNLSGSSSSGGSSVADGEETSMTDGKHMTSNENNNNNNDGTGDTANGDDNNALDENSGDGLGIGTAEDVNNILEAAKDAGNVNLELDQQPMPPLGEAQPEGNPTTVVPEAQKEVSSVTDNSESTIRSYLSKYGELNTSPENLKREASKYAREVGFSQLKFIDSDALLLMDDKLCNSVLKYMRVPTYREATLGEHISEADKKSNDNVFSKRLFIWDSIKDYIRKALNTCRSNRCGEMKNCFMSTYILN